MSSDDDDSVRIAVLFQEAYWKDREKGRARSLGEYLELFPDHRSVVIREYLAAEGVVQTLQGASDSAPDQSPPATEEQIGPYRIVREIGRGGQGAVYLADDTRLGRRVALKVLTSSTDSRPDAVMRFHREAAVASRLDHPGICSVFDLGRANGVSFIAMRYVEGESLAKLVAAARSSASACVELPSEREVPGPAARIQRIVELISQTARALHVAHEAGIVHRDIKPANIMLGSDGRPVILDFGIAREESPTAVTLTGTGEIFGTPAYLAPEQIDPAEGGVDRRVDVYALGVTLYECLTLRRPFDAPTRLALFSEITHKEPVDPRRLNPAISSDLSVCVRTAIEKARDRRYRSASAFADDLDAIREGRPIAARPVGAAARMFRWAKREPAKAAVVALLAIVVPALAALASYVYATRDSVTEARRARSERDVEEKLERGFFELGEGDAPSAGAIFQETLRLDPNSIEAVAGVVLSLQEAGRYDEARAFVDRYWQQPGLSSELSRTKPAILNLLYTRGPESAPARPKTAIESFLAGSFALQEGHRGNFKLFKDALAHFEWAILNSRNARALFYMQATHAAVHVEDPTQLRRYVAILQNLWPESFMTRFYAATSLKFVGRTAEALPALEALARERPSMAVTHISLASGYEDVRRYEEAARAYAAALALSPTSVMARRGLGVALTKLKKLDTALVELREAVRSGPRDSLSREALADALFSSGDYDGGIAEMRECLRLGPRNPAHVRHVIASRLDRAGRLEESIAEYRVLVANHPSYAAGWMALGLGLSKVEENDEAKRMFEKSLELTPSDPEALRNIGIIQMRRAQKLRDEGDLTGALLAAEESARLRPEEADSHFVLGTVRQNSGDAAGAAAAYAEATRRNAEYAEAWCNLGLRLWDIGRFEEALPPLRRGHELGTTRPAWSHPSAKWLASCEKAVAKDALLRAVLRGESRPASFAAWVELAEFSHKERTAVEEVEILSRAIADLNDPEQLLKLRVLAARAALRAARANSAESRALVSRPVPAERRAEWARRAAAWLSEQLTAIESQVAANEWPLEKAKTMVSRWLADPALEPLKNPDAAGENAETWRGLRKRIDAFLSR